MDAAATGANGQSRRSDQDAEQPLQYRLNQEKMAKRAQIDQTVVAFTLNQIEFKMELADPDAQSSKIQRAFSLWVKQSSCVINRTACRSILAGAAFLVVSVNSSSCDALTSEQRDDQLAANSAAARNFIEDMGLSMINHEHDRQPTLSLRLLRRLGLF